MYNGTFISNSIISQYFRYFRWMMLSSDTYIHKWNSPEHSCNWDRTCRHLLFAPVQNEILFCSNHVHGSLNCICRYRLKRVKIYAIDKKCWFSYERLDSSNTKGSYNFCSITLLSIHNSIAIKEETNLIRLTHR